MMSLTWYLTLLLLTVANKVSGHEDYFWAIAHTWPIPQPIHNESEIFPQFYSTKCQMEEVCKSRDKVLTETKSYNESMFSLEPTLCFSFNESAPCVKLKMQTLGAFLNPLQNLNKEISSGILSQLLSQITSGATSGSGNVINDSTSMNITTLWVNVTGIVPQIQRDNSFNNTHEQFIPRCREHLPFDYPPKFLACSGRTDRVVLAGNLIASPELGHYEVKKNKTKLGWPFTAWLVGNRRGAFTDLSPFLFLEKGKIELFNTTGTYNDFSKQYTARWYEAKHSSTLEPGLVCVDPPYLLLMFNYSDRILDCRNNSNEIKIRCIISQCWNKSRTDSMVVMKLPTLVPIPVQANPKDFPIANVLRYKRDFGITTAIVVAIAASATAAALAGVAMASQIKTAQEINQVIQQTSTALITQQSLNSHLASGIILLNKRIDYVKATLEDLFQVMMLSCVDKKSHLCITPYSATVNQSKAISQYLAGNWSLELDKLQANFSSQIYALNGTRINPITIQDFTDWIHSTFSFFKEWIGVGMFGTVCIGGVVLVLFLLIKIRDTRRREKVVLARALAAIDQGQSPEVWINLYKDL